MSKDRFYASGTLDSVTIEGREYRGALPTIIDRDDPRIDALVFPSEDLRDKVLNLLNDQEKVVEGRMNLINTLAAKLTEVTEVMEAHRAREHDMADTIALIGEVVGR